MYRVRGIEVVLVAIALSIFSLTAPNTSSAVRISQIAYNGQLAPGTGGGVLASVGSLTTLNDAGESAFIGTVTGGGTTTQGLFVADRTGALTAIALVGDPAPGSDAGTFSGFNIGTGGRGVFDLNSTGEVIFAASVASSGGLFQGLYLVDAGGVMSRVAYSLDTAPDTGGGLLLGFDAVALNDLGEAAFKSSLALGSVSEGLFRLDVTGVVYSLVLPGDPAPGTWSGVYTDFGMGALAISNAGDTAFFANVSGAAHEGIFLEGPTGLPRLIASRRQLAPGSEGGTFLRFNSTDPPALNEAGDVAFDADIQNSPIITSGIYLTDASGVVSAIVATGDSVPGTAGRRLGSVWSPSMNDHGEITFRASLSGAPVTRAFFHRDRSGSTTLVGKSGATVPGTGGKLFGPMAGIGTYPVNNAGEIAFSLGFAFPEQSTGRFLVDLDYTATHGNSGYRFLPGTASWFESRDAARSLFHEGIPGHLVTITSQAELDFLVGEFADATTPTIGAWIGGREIPGQEGIFEWISDEGMLGTCCAGFTAWSPGFPDVDAVITQEFVAFSEDGWRDLPSSVLDTTGFLVEFSPPTEAIHVDLGDLGTTPTSHWSEIPSANTTTQGLLDSISGLASSVSLTTAGWDTEAISPGAWTAGPVDFVETEIVEDGFELATPSGTGELIFDGVDPAANYRVSIVSAAASSSVMSIEVNGQGSTKDYLDMPGVSSDSWNAGPGQGQDNYLRFDDITAHPTLGTITVRVRPISGAPARVQAVRLDRVPEPGLAIGLLAGVLGLAHAQRVRNRAARTL